MFDHCPMLKGHVTRTNNAITRRWIVVSTSNLMEMINVGGSTRGTLSRSVGQINRKYKYGGLFVFSTKKQLKTSSNRKRKYGRFAHAQYKIRYITLIYGGISEILASYKKSGSRYTMVTLHFRPEVEIWQFRACAVKHTL